MPAHGPADACMPSAASGAWKTDDKAKPSVLVTGADGFIGRHLVPFLAARGYRVIAASRAATIFENPNVAAVPMPDLSKMFDWHPLLGQCDAVVHLAGAQCNRTQREWPD